MSKVIPRPPRRVFVEVSITASTRTVSGPPVTEEELAEWVESAISFYHTMRAGHVGIGAHSRIEKPCVKVRET